MKNKTISAITTVMAVIALAAPITFGTFAVLRVCNVISWSWWLVTLPLWATGLILFSAAAAFILIIVSTRTVMSEETFRAEMRAKRAEKGGTL